MTWVVTSALKFEEFGQVVAAALATDGTVVPL